MSRTLTLTAADPPIVPGEIVTLVREGDWDDFDSSPRRPVPPAEFVQACAPCRLAPTILTLCDRVHPLSACLGCRIHLVGPCPNCPTVGACAVCGSEGIYTDGTATLGYGYAMGQPEPSADGKWALRVQVAA